MYFIVGGKGFAGSAIVNLLKNQKEKYKIIQKENQDEFFGKNCDVLIFANGNPYRFKANKDPFYDFCASFTSMVKYVHKINFKKFILLSTVNVYDKKFSKKTTSEDTIIDETRLDTYGYHKLLIENYVKQYCNNYLIFRLPILVGNNLNKNYAYDFVNKRKKVKISPNSKLNFLNVDTLALTILKTIKLQLQNEIFNLASNNSMKIKDIEKIIGYDTEYSTDAKNNLQNYQINIKKIQKYSKMDTSEKAIKDYFKLLKK
jgi:nucleoside-diphosphate-sugar epimerase